MTARAGMAMAVAGLLLVLLLPAAASADRPFAVRYTANDAGSITFAANTLMTCPDSAPTCAAARAGTQGGSLGNNNGYAMTYVDADGLPGTFNSSTANLSLPADATVLWAGLYWAGDTAAAAGGAAAPTPAALNTVSFRTPIDAAYQTVTALTVDSTATRYSAFADVTDIVRAAGVGTYTVANVQAGTGEDRYAGWDLIVVYRDPTQPPRNLTVFDGLATVSRATPVSTLSLSGFRTPPFGPVRSTVGLWSSEGDRTSTGDSATLNSTPISDASNPANNVFNSSITRFAVPVTDKNPNYENQLGFDTNLFREDGVLANGATSATIRLTTGGETYYPDGVFFTTDVFAPEIRPVKSVVDVDGGATERGDELEYTVRLTNQGQDPSVGTRFFDPIPAETSYVPGSLAVTPANTTTGACGPFVTQSDTPDDGLAEYDADAGRVIFRLGTNASGLVGGRIGPGESVCARFRVQVAAGAPRTTEIANQGYASFIGLTLGTQFPAEYSNTVTNVVAGADLVPSKTHTGGAFLAGEAYDFTLGVANAGDLATSGTVTVQDTFDPAQFSDVNSASGTGWTCNLAGGTVTCTRANALPAGQSYPPITINATVADPAPGTVINTATVSGGGDTDDTNNSATDAGGATAQADLSIAKSADQERVPARGEITFTLDALNRGPSTATDVQVTDALAPNFTAIEVTSSRGSCDRTVVVCSLGALAPGQGATITIRALVEDAAVDSTVTNSALIGDNGASDDPSPANNAADLNVDVPLSSDLQVDKSFAPAPNPSAGDLVTFTVNVTNAGPSTATNVVSTDVLPDAFYSPDNVTVPTGTYTGGGTCTWFPAARAMRCAIASLDPGQTETITITARLRPDSRGKTVVNSIGAISDSVDPNPGLATDSVSFVPIPAADLELNKLGPADPVAPGGVGRYTFQYANKGPSNAPDVTIRDTLPAGLSFVGDTAGACAAAGQAITCSLGALDAGASGELGVDVRVDPALAGETVRNAATIASEPSDPNLQPAEVVPSSNSDAAELVVGPLPPPTVPPSPTVPPPTTPAAGQPRLVLEKSVRGAGARVGDELAWSVRVRNTGDGPARDVVVTDTPASGLTAQGAQPSAGSCTGTGPVRCSLGDLAAGASAEVVLRTQATRRGRLANAAAVASSTPTAPDSVLSARATALVRGADVRLTKTSSRASVGAFGRVRFTLVARSRAKTTVSGVRVCDRMPDGLGFVAAPGARYRGGQACWTLRLRAGQTRRLTLTARAAQLGRTRRIRNVATLRGPTVAVRSARAGVTVRGLAGPAGRCTALPGCGRRPLL